MWKEPGSVWAPLTDSDCCCCGALLVLSQISAFLLYLVSRGRIDEFCPDLSFIQGSWSDFFNKWKDHNSIQINMCFHLHAVSPDGCIVVPCLCPFSSMLFYIFPLQKNVRSGSIPACRDRKGGREAACHETIHWEKQRLERTAELFQICANSDGPGDEVHVKQNLKFCGEHFSSHSHKVHFGLVEFCQRVFSQDLSLVVLAEEALEGTLNKTFGFEGGL